MRWRAIYLQLSYETFDFGKKCFQTKNSEKTDITNIASFKPTANTLIQTENAPNVVKVKTRPTASRKIQNMTTPFDWQLNYCSHYLRCRRQVVSFL